MTLGASAQGKLHECWSGALGVRPEYWTTTEASWRNGSVSASRILDNKLDFCSARLTDEHTTAQAHLSDKGDRQFKRDLRID